tara:strand:- start:104891 stop:105487 length:597 start_codon:yes stop_codon:yes gene_type:complete
MKFEKIKLPYAYDALEPHISSDTVKTHYDKHHQGYVNKLNDSDLSKFKQDTSLEDIIKNEKGSIYNNAAQILNHDLYWQSINPESGGQPSSALEQVINAEFSSLDEFRKMLFDAAISEFGSGWAWLVLDASKKLNIISTTDAVNPLTKGSTPLFVIDVWEHAYYLDYKNKRAEYINAVLDHLINWDNIEERYSNNLSP